MKNPGVLLTPHPLDVAMGANIRARRKTLGVSQTALAEAIGLTFQQIQKYERGFNRVSFSRLVDISQALDCRVVELIGDIDSEGVESPRFRNDSAYMRVDGAPELLAAYSIAPPPLKRVLLKLVVEIARDRSIRTSEAEASAEA